jgi:uncharacterized membrane protein YecN with MAPEG domain
MSTTVVICIALLGILLFLLGANVTRIRAVRGKSGETQMPTDPADRLFIAQRAHGNAAEYIPTLIALLIVGSTLTGGWWLDALAVTAVVARAVHAFGLLTAKTMNTHGPVRDAGAIFTYLSGLALGVTVLAAL